MVRAILEERKTQTRRAVNIRQLCGPNETHESRGRWKESDGLWRSSAGKYNVWSAPVSCPYGKRGDRLFVRETWGTNSRWDDIPPSQLPIDLTGETPHARIFYAADYDGHVHPDRLDRWRPSIHMPRAASRITLEITGIRVERLNEISEDDAIAEGSKRNDAPGEEWDGTYLTQAYIDGVEGAQDDEPHGSAVEWYRDLWKSINGPDSWNENPWVWVVEFARVSNAQVRDAAPHQSTNEG